MENHRQRFIHNNKNIFVKSKEYVIGIIVGIYAFFALFFKSLIYSNSARNNSSTTNQYRGGQGRPGGSNSGQPEKFGGGCFNLKGMGGG
jgi:hypothetical protein